jgi:hypothetical protein
MKARQGKKFCGKSGEPQGNWKVPMVIPARRPETEEGLGRPSLPGRGETAGGFLFLNGMRKDYNTYGDGARCHFWP